MQVNINVQKQFTYPIEVTEEQFLETLKKEYCRLYRKEEVDVYGRPSTSCDTYILEKVYQQAAKEIYEKNPEAYAN